jgi:hypothetical protein
MSDKNQEIEKNVSEQAGIEGQRKEVNVEDYPKAVALGQLLKDIDFPADKQKVIQHVQQRSGSNADSQNILSTLQNIEDRLSKKYRSKKLRRFCQFIHVDWEQEKIQDFILLLLVHLPLPCHHLRCHPRPLQPFQCQLFDSLL